MQLKKLFILSAAALLSATPPKSTAQTWTTVKDYQFFPGYSSVSLCIAAGGALDPGDVFSGGWGYPGITSLSGLVLKTTDTDENQNGWTLIDDSNTYPLQEGYQTTVHGLRFDSTGGYLYEIGSLSDPCTQSSCPGLSYWYIRWSTDLGVNWTTDPPWQYDPGTTNCWAEKLAADGSGNIFVVGYAQDSTGLNHWVVRKGVPVPGQTQTSWATVDNFGTSGARASGIGFVPRFPGVVGGVPPYPDSVFAVGHTRTITNEKHGSNTNYSWVVRRSTDAGALGSWVTVDQFELPTGYSTPNPYGVGADSQGNIYVAGDNAVPLGKHKTPTSQWLVRKSADGGNTWATVDAFSYVPGGASDAFALAHDSVGNVVVVGTAAADLAGSEWLWVVRSPNAQGVWQNLDVYQDPGAYQSIPWDVVADGAGNLLVTGAAYFETGGSHWIVRKLPAP